MTTLLRLTFVEAKLWLREVAPPLFSLVLPVLLLLIFGSFEDARQPNAALGNNRRLDTTVPSMALVVSMAMIAFFMLPGAIAIYRDKGVLRRFATTPVRPATLLTSQVLVNLVMAAAGVVLLVVVGVVHLGMRAPHPLFLPTFLFGTAALFAVGLVIASLSPNVKVAQVYSFGLFFPSAFFAGIYLPKEEMPPVLARISDLTPLGAFRQSTQDAWSGQVPQASHLLALAVTAVLTGVLAVLIYRRTVVD